MSVGSCWWKKEKGEGGRGVVGICEMAEGVRSMIGGMVGFGMAPGGRFGSCAGRSSRCDRSVRSGRRVVSRNMSKGLWMTSTDVDSIESIISYVNEVKAEALETLKKVNATVL